MPNAISLLAQTDTSITDFTRWCRETIRYMLTYCGTTIGPVADEDVSLVLHGIIEEVEQERDQLKQADGTADQLTQDDIQAVVYQLLATLAARSAKLTNGVQVNQTLEQFANLITEVVMQGPPGKVVAVQLPLAAIKATCPALGQLVTMKLDLRKSAARDAQIAKDRKDGVIGRVGQAPPASEVEAKPAKPGTAGC